VPGRRGGDQEMGIVLVIGMQCRGATTSRRDAFAAANCQVTPPAGRIAESLLERHHTLSGGARRGSGVSALLRLVSVGRRGLIPAAAPIACGCSSIEFMPSTISRACDGTLDRTPQTAARKLTMQGKSRPWCVAKAKYDQTSHDRRTNL
jgi:hypothetical protein